MNQYIPLDTARARRNPPSVWDMPSHIRLGAPHCFIPAAFQREQAGELPGHKPLPRSVTGRINYINRAHRYFRVAYTLNGQPLNECFKF